MNENTVTAKEATLAGAVASLEQISWRLKNLVFGESPSKDGEAQAVATDKLTNLRNDIEKINSRLMEVADRLEVIGK